MSLEALNIGASLFSAFTGRSKAPNLDELFRQGLDQSLGYLQDYSSPFMNAYRQLNPLFKQLESNVLQGLQDVDPGGAMHSAFQRQLLQSQDRRGVALSPNSDLSSTLRGMQFQNQMVDRARQAAMGVMSAGPYDQIFNQLNRTDLPLEQAALNSQVRQANRAQMLNAFSSGINNHMAITGMNNQQSFRNQLMSMYSGQGSSGGTGGSPPFDPYAVMNAF